MTVDSRRRKYGTHETVATEEPSEDEEHTNDERVPKAVYLYAFCAAINSCNLGYDIGVSTNVGPLVQEAFQLSNPGLELFLGSINFWSIGGAMLSPLVTDALGRRSTFFLAALGFIGGIAVMATATSFEILLIARAVVGIGVGIGEAIDPMYISEISPPSHRGFLVSWAEAGVAVGVVLGFTSSLIFWNMDHASDVKWRCMLALGAVLPCVMLVLIWKVMPESPRWLLCKGKREQAKGILQTLYPPHVDIDHVVETIEESLATEQAASQTVGWTSLLCRPSPAIRRMLTVGIGIAIIQQAVGIDSVMFYLVYVIKNAGIQSELGQTLALIVLGIVKLVFVFVGAELFDKVGRRKMLFISLMGCAASLVLVSITFTETTSASEILCILGLATYLAFFSTGLGPGNWVVVSEVFCTSIRAKAMSLAVLPNRITATIMASTFLTMAKALTWPGFFLYLAGISILSCIFLYLYLPETKGKSLEEMMHYFAELTGDRSILDMEEKLQRQAKSAVDAEAPLEEKEEKQNGVLT